MREILNNRIIKRVLLLTIVVIITLYGFFLIDKSRAPEEAQILTNEGNIIPTVRINKTFEGNVLLKMGSNLQLIELPKTLSVYSLENNTIPENQMQNIVKRLNLNDQPYISKDPVMGETLIYSSPTASLRIIPSKQIIDLNLEVGGYGPVINEVPPDDVLLKTSKDVLNNYSLFQDVESLRIYRVRTFFSDEYGHVSEQPNANTIIINLTQYIDNYPILAPTHETGTVMVTLNGNFEVMSVYIDDIPSYNKIGAVNIKSFQEITEELNSSAQLKSVKNGEISLFTLNQNTVKEGIIDKIEIAYLQENTPSQNYLQPIFLLSGNLRLLTDQEISSTFYMQAAK